MKFGIDMGHNAPPDTGAVGWAKEDDLTKAVGNQVIDKLEALGHEVVNCTPRRASSVVDSLRRRVSTANARNVDLYVSIHFNAFNGRANGTEVFAASSAGRRYAQPVLNQIINLGFYNRGVKNGSHFFVLKNTNMPAILIECCFIDSWRDRNLYGTDAMVNAIVKGLTGQEPPQAQGGGSEAGGSGEVTRDEQVLKLQQQLNRLRVRDRNGKVLVEDGLWGSNTASAVARFNDLMAIRSDDSASAATWKALEDIFEKPILRQSHATGKAVRYVQFRIGTAIDGIFGPNTARSVRRWQASVHITADGVVGPQTWSKLLG
ncbi:MAG: cell wall hydrolase [Spirulina sp. SIO3F2]|nr:cell wall hydrolase [Spirulina sp. SIO3F2]